MTMSRNSIWQEMIQLSPLCSGSLHEQYLPCGKPSCRCHDSKSPKLPSTTLELFPGHCRSCAKLAWASELRPMVVPPDTITPVGLESASTRAWNSMWPRFSRCCSATRSLRFNQRCLRLKKCPAAGWQPTGRNGTLPRLAAWGPLASTG